MSDPRPATLGRSSARLALALAVGIALFGVAAGRPARADFHDGLTAFQNKDFPTALKELQPLARQGDARAQRIVGILYRDGLAVPQDFVQAHMWFNLAAAAGETDAANERDDLVRRMTPDQVAEAQHLAAAWQPEGAATAPAAGPQPQGEAPPQTATAEAPPPESPAIGAPAAPAAETGPMSDTQITDLQWQLAVHGYDPGPADGAVGPRTRAAIQFYQTDAGLPVDGEPSLALLDHLQFSNPPVRNQRPAESAEAAPAAPPQQLPQAWTPPTSAPSEPPPGWTPPGAAPMTAAPAEDSGLAGLMRIYTLTVQQTLAEKGYRPGPADGVLGPQTRLAIRKYQQDYHLPVTGEVSLELVNHLRLISGTPVPPQG
jgi:peptidoglycan hydrolase-like protein with peptidoglycan-binding domain